MDIFSWMVSWGNMDVLAYWHLVLGIGFIVVQLMFYAAIFGGAIYWILQKKRYKYSVDIEVVGPDNTIYEFQDTARILNDGSKIKLRKRGLLINAPNRKDILYVTGNMFIKGKMRLYQFGETNFSYTPIETKLNADNKIQKVKFEPIEPKVSLIKAMIQQSQTKFAMKSMLMEYLPHIISALFIVVCFILFLVLLEQFKPIAELLANSIDKSSLILDRFNQCQMTSATTAAITPQF